MKQDVTYPENWVAPRELTRALPRDVRMSTAGTVISIFSAVLILAGAVGFVLMRNTLAEKVQHDQMLRASGREAPGDVLRMWRSGKSHDPMVSYSFSADGRRFEGEARAPGTVWDGLHAGDPISVRYLPSAPTINHPAGWPQDLAPVWLAYTVPVALAFAVFMILTNLRRQSSLLSGGIPAAAVVTRTSRVKGGFLVRYQFRTKDGTQVAGSANRNSRPADGEVLCILYDPQRPRRNRPYPLDWYRLA